MKTSLTRNEKSFMIVTLVVVAAFCGIFKTVNFKVLGSKSKFERTEAINYEMARPEQAYSGYSLDGREIDEQYEAIQAKAVKAKKATEVAKAKAKKVDAKKQDKKAAVAQAVSKPVVRPLGSASVSPIAKSAANSASEQVSTNSNINSGSNYSNSAAAVAAQDPQSDSSANDDKSKAKKSFEKWRAEIFATPTKETMTLFINAFRKGDVTATEYQAMAQDLIDQSDSNLKGLGLMALRAQPSLASLSQMVHVEAQLPAALQAYVQAAYLSYFQPQNVQYLNQALQTKDKTLVLKSLTLLTTNLPKIKTGDVSAFIDARNRRDAASETLSMNSFRTLIPALTSLASSQEQNLSGIAGQLANLIQANSTATSTAVAGL